VQGKQRERLVSLAARAAVESDPKKFHDLLLELNQLLSETERVRPIRGDGKNATSTAAKPLTNERF
jgi:hypothetical protein